LRRKIASIIVGPGAARLRELEEENEALRREVQRYRDRRLPAVREGG